MDSLCLQPLFLRILNLCGVFLKIICFIVPIILIVKLIMDIYKQIINPDDKDFKGKITNRIVACIIIFLVPTIISLLFSFIEKVVATNSYSDISVCREFANIEHIKVLEEKIEEEELNLYIDEKDKNLSSYEKKVEAVRAIVEKNKAASSTDGGSYISVGQSADKSRMIICGSGSKYNAGLFNAVKSSGYKTRAGVVAAAVYLSSRIDSHIPYYWSGGHGHSYSGFVDKGDNFIGVSNKWGCSVKMEFGGTDKQKKGSSYPFGMDCNGFVNWAILNGGYYTGDPNQKVNVGTGSSVFSSISGISITSVKASNARGQIKPGDVAFKPGHVGMVVEVQDNYYKVAEEMGYDYGLVISKIDYGSRFTDIVQMDNFYANYKKDAPLWNGFK